jgi:DNA-binding NarL/FixJ family response regulator
LRALCVGRHEYLSDHLGRFFGRFGLETMCAVGIEGAVAASAHGVARGVRPDVVICDYDLLATMPLDSWERDATLSRTPVVAVSMTRRPDELHPLDVNGIGGFLYLPRLGREEALAALRAVTAAAPVASPLADAVRVAAPQYSPAAARDWPRPAAAGSAARISPPSARDEAPAR